MIHSVDNRERDARSTADKPVFIGGLAHSGKTPLRLMLAAHPNLALSRRTYMWTRYYNRYGDLKKSRNLERCLAALLASRDVAALHPDAVRIKREFGDGPATYARLFALFHRHHAERLGRPRWGDQLGFVERYARPIFTAYPSAKMIHMIRDPRDRCRVSAVRSGRYPGSVGMATAKWVASARLTERNTRSFAGRYKVVRFERLVRDPEETIRDVCEFLNEDFTPEMVGAAKLPSLDGPEFTLPDTGGSWSLGDLAFTEAYAGRLMLTLGYSPRVRPRTLGDRLLSSPGWIANWAGMLAWRAWNDRGGAQ